MNQDLKRAIIRTMGLFMAVLGAVMLATDLLYFSQNGSSAPPYDWLRSGTGFVYWLLGFYYMKSPK